MFCGPYLNKDLLLQPGHLLRHLHVALVISVWTTNDSNYTVTTAMTTPKPITLLLTHACQVLAPVAMESIAKYIILPDMYISYNIMVTLGSLLVEATPVCCGKWSI